MPDPVPGPDEVLVAVKACGICGSDVHGMDGSTGRRRPPIIMGHEAAGTIVATGANVAGWASGERVTFDSTIYCGKCSYCRQGQINLCDNRRVLGVSCADYRQDGAFAEYVTVPQHILYRLPEALSFEHAAMAEPLSVAYHAVTRPGLPLNASAVVVGAGMIGLLVVQVLRQAGCREIIAVDLDDGRLALAQKMGATLALRSDREDVVARVQAATEGRGADASFEVVGITPTVKLAVNTVRKGGAVTLVGNVSPNVELPLQAVVTRELTLYGSCASRLEYPACLDLMARGAVDVRPIISASASLADGGVWFDRLYAGAPGLMKVMLLP
ncbi:MAG TPA: galactitol-1-phosphate 5-dehydrogenase [Anaerolineae bacterium]